MEKTMQPGESAAGVVARVGPEVDQIDGLITITAHEDKVVALITSSAELAAVRRGLVELGVPEGMLDVQSIDEAVIPYPITDDRLRRWLEEAGQSEAIDAMVSVRKPRLRMTPRGIGKAVLILVVGWFVASILLFILLMIYEWWAAS
jgi:hypothetical protein